MCYKPTSSRFSLKRQRCSPGIVVSGNIKIMRVFQEVRWSSLKRERQTVELYSQLSHMYMLFIDDKKISNMQVHLCWKYRMQNMTDMDSKHRYTCMLLMYDCISFMLLLYSCFNIQLHDV